MSLWVLQSQTHKRNRSNQQLKVPWRNYSQCEKRSANWTCKISCKKQNKKNRLFQDQPASEGGREARWEMQPMLLGCDTNRKPDWDAAIAADPGTDDVSWFKEEQWAAQKASLCSWQDLRLTPPRHEVVTPVTTLLTKDWRHLAHFGCYRQTERVCLRIFFPPQRPVFTPNKKSTLDIAAAAANN